VSIELEFMQLYIFFAYDIIHKGLHKQKKLEAGATSLLQLYNGSCSDEQDHFNKNNCF
jgi:hypothetical protein